jgi:hypothetical protein
MVFLNHFSKANGNLKFKYDVTDAKWVNVETIITRVALTYNAGTKLYALAPADAVPLNDFVATQQ